MIAIRVKHELKSEEANKILFKNFNIDSKRKFYYSLYMLNMLTEGNTQSSQYSITYFISKERVELVPSVKSQIEVY